MMLMSAHWSVAISNRLSGHGGSLSLHALSSHAEIFSAQFQL